MRAHEEYLDGDPGWATDWMFDGRNTRIMISPYTPTSANEKSHGNWVWLCVICKLNHRKPSVAAEDIYSYMCYRRQQSNVGGLFWICDQLPMLRFDCHLQRSKMAKIHEP
jgi:hypothetical protein